MMPQKDKNRLRKYSIKTIFTLSLVLLFSCTKGLHFNNPRSQHLSEKLHGEIHHLDAEYGLWGAMVINLNDKDTLLNLNSNMAFTPASVTKLFTVAAFELSGSELNNGHLCLRGFQSADSSVDTLIFRGGGVTLNGENKIDSLLLTGLKALSDSGITLINKAILIDKPDEDEIFHPGWTMDDFTGYYASTPSFMSALSNLWEINLKRSADTVAIEIFPDSPYRPQVVVDSSEHFFYRWEFGAHQIPFLHVGLSKTDHFKKIFLPMFSPQYVWGERLKKALVDSGYCADNLPIIYERLDDRASDQTIKSFPALPRDSLYELALSYSDNFIAGQLLRSLAYADSGIYGREAGLVVMDSLLNEVGIPKGVDFSFFDGSGLSRYNWITPGAISKLLNIYTENPVLFNSLAENGKRGTLKHRFGYFKENVLLRGKTGSMRGVRNFAGIIDLPDGNSYELVFLVNNFTVSSREVDKIVRRLILYLIYSGINT